ncbi:aminotransferase class I/II-fold pyridoxal phosphate-dependent enzyme [Streptomyces sp. H10-C2]|uniref:aminotransferase class I/II-fold pyridoxal phosphate-dependent enzyme n=1 Tax=unclassified Streptomyces TaxID=2593676 RepID=UPI0024BB7032|nr:MULTISPECIES: aminotransferase class I/II-fold pyridoxal phosphate-dependent enzyme [unclassified Streptomyces]MDJ0344337.1 aminotransferase class I/II-fold pyridoxal phosphate-dependent enzyme [Streptomyces sp. PH10-H1]MDJ0373706.1 aminotransferase class I/II-fold pyridoxal phosphate-dependent enzyme [Streptomyces sp. H10-C2]
MQGTTTYETPYELRPDPGLPVPPYWTAHLTDAGPEPAGGSPALRLAAAGYWERRGLWTDPGRIAAAPGAEPLLLAILAATGGGLVLARPSAAWQAPVARLLGRAVSAVPTSPEGGGAPDPFALLETVRRAREEGAEPSVLLLSAADDPTGTVSSPELLHESCEAAAEAGLIVVSDETYSDTCHHPGTVLVSPAEMLPDRTIVLTDLGGSLAPLSCPVALARFPDSDEGAELRARVAHGCAELRAVLSAPVGSAAAYVLTEPDDVRAHSAAANRLHASVAAAAYHAVTASGALCRPPQAGFQLYVELTAHDSHDLPDAPALERHLTRRLGRQVLGGHRFGDDPAALRVRIDTGPLHGATDEQRRTALDAADPREVPHVSHALTELEAAFTELTAG